MPTATVRDIQELPAVLTMKDVQDVLGICKPKAYELAHTQGFPVVKIGRTFRVPKTAFLRWLEEQAGEQEE
jgi:excisionase family DNA binding protein